jgi:putative transposase
MPSKHLSTYKSGRNVVYSCKYHIVFCPKYRRKVLNPPIASRLKDIIAEISTTLQVELIELEIMPDHVHLLVDINPSLGVSSFVSKAKGLSASLLRKEFPELKRKLPCLWTSSYFCATVGGAPLEIVKRYIENQKNV